MSQTRTQLEAAIRYKIQDYTTQKLSSAAVLDAINDTAEDLWGQLSGMSETGYCMGITTPVNIVNQLDAYALPANLVSIDNVQVWDGANWQTMEKINPQQWERWPDPGSIMPAIPYTTPCAYCLFGDTVLLLPCPQQDITNGPGGLRFIGRLAFTPLAGANDTSGMPAVLDSVIINLAAATLLLVEGSSAATAWESKGQAKRERIMTQLAVRDQSPRTMNTEFQDDPW